MTQTQTQTLWQEVKTCWRAVVICIFVTIGAFQFGYDSSYYSGILAMQQFLKIFGTFDAATSEYAMTASRQSLSTSIINAGEFIGAASAFAISSRFGRRGGLFVSSGCVLVGVVMQAAATHLVVLILGRLVLGFAVGLISCFVPLYVADCAPARLRGALVSMYQFCIGQGLLLGVIVDNATKGRPDTGAFRIPIAVQLIFPIILIPGLLLLVPESPRWLVEKGRLDEARRSLLRLNGPRPDLVDQEMDTLQACVLADANSPRGSFLSIFKRGPDGRKAYITCTLQFFQQFTGINFITSYGIIFFIAIGFTNAFLIQLGLYLIAMPAVWFSQYGIERYGRRPLLIASGVLVAAILLSMGGCGLAKTKTASIDNAVVVMVYLFLIVFNLAWGPTVWVITSEMSTGPNRGQLMSLSTCCNWFFTWLVSFTFPYLDDADAANLGPKIGFIYGSITIAAVVWVYFCLPETAQRSLEEIDAMFEQRIPAKAFKSYQVSLPTDPTEVTKVELQADHKD